MDLKELRNIDFLMALFYGGGKMLSFGLWIIVAIAILSTYDICITGFSLYATVFLGCLGNYYYGVRDYQSKSKGQMLRRDE